MKRTSGQIYERILLNIENEKAEIQNTLNKMENNMSHIEEKNLKTILKVKLVQLIRLQLLEQRIKEKCVSNLETANDMSTGKLHM